MKTIDQQASRAFWNAEAFSKQNTVVRVDGNFVRLYLHDSEIATRRCNESGLCRVSFAGYPTLTTRARLAALVSPLSVRVSKARRECKIGNAPIDPTKWYLVERSTGAIIEAKVCH